MSAPLNTRGVMNISVPFWDLTEKAAQRRVEIEAKLWTIHMDSI